MAIRNKFVLCGLFLSPLTLALKSSFGNAIYSNHFGIPGNAAFDYVIIGGGTAGLAIATRLAENGENTVAVIEAGGFYEQDNGNLTVVPGYYLQNAASPGVNCGFQSTPQPQLNNLTFTYNRGKTLGGTSALNAMIYQRGTRDSYQAWADLLGDQSWCFDEILPYFHKSTNYTAPNNLVRASNASVPNPSTIAYNETGGSLAVHVSFPNYAAPISSWGQLAFQELGFPNISDFSSGELIGAQYCSLTVRPGDETRSSSEASYLQSFLKNSQSNLKIYPRSLTERILFENKTAYGVLVNTGGTAYVLSAKKEVILSAGAVQSPQLLMISGIGPKAELEKYKIPVLSDRSGVGPKHDHVLFPVIHQVNVDTLAAFFDPSYASSSEHDYNTNGTGFLTNTGADYLGWEKLPEANRANLTVKARGDIDTFPPDWPDFEYVVESFGSEAPQAPKLPSNIAYASIQVALVAPLSRGTISIISAGSTDAPLINLGWLTNDTDRQMAIQAIKRGRDYFATSSIQPILIGEEVMPGKNVTTNEEILAYAKATIATVYHPSCTCAMGKVNDTNAVIDSRARVIGVKNLRVVDASSFPLLPPGHPQSTIYMLAEKIADDILMKERE